MKKKIEITKDTTVGELMANNAEKYQPILMGFGMHCFGCPMSQMETLEEAAAAHEIDVNDIIAKLK